MQKALLLTIAFGTALGLILPSGPKSAPPAPAASPPAAAKAETEQTELFEGASPASATRIQRQGNGHFYIDAEVNGGNLVHFLVDTGASSVALTVDDAQRLGVGFSPSEFTVIGSGASGEVRGQMVTLSRVAIGGKEVRDVPGAVVERLGVSLLGQAYLSKLSSVEMSGDTMTLR